MKLDSILNKCITEVYKSTNLKEAKDCIILILESSKIKSTDKSKMLYEISNIKTLTKLQFYITNALLKYEGLGVSC